MQVQNILQYASLFTITDDFQVPHKKYVDDAIAAIGSGSSSAGNGIVWSSSRFNLDLATNSGLELTATDGTGQLRLKGLQNYSAVASADLISLGHNSSGNLVTSSRSIAESVAGSGLSYNISTGNIDLGGSLLNDNTTISRTNSVSTTFEVELIKTSPFTRAGLGLTSTGVASLSSNDDSAGYYISASNSNAITLHASSPIGACTFRVNSAGYFISSTRPEYTLPTAGNKFGLAVDDSGKIVFESPANLSASIKYTQTVTGNGTDTSFTITHNKDTRDVIVQVYDNTTYEQVIVTTTRPTVNTVNIIFATAPANGVTYRVVII